MAAHTNIEEGILVKKEELLSDLSKVYREGFYHDITIVFPDNVRVSTNRFMLVCRIPYFATLLSSDFTDKSSDLSLGVCSSDIFKKILDFVWEGKLQLSDMNLSTILSLLETSRFLCIDLLVDGIGEYIAHQFNSKKVDFVSTLYALDFSISHEFQKISDIILHYVDQNIEEISSLPEFQTVSLASIMAFLSMKKGRVSSDISVFKAFLKWVECNNQISASMIEEMVNTFDLENFSNSDLETLEKSSLFSQRRLFYLARSRLQVLEKTIATKDETIATKDETIATNEETIATNEETIATKDKNIAMKDQTIVAKEIVIKSLLPITRLNLTFVRENNLMSSEYEYDNVSVWKMDAIRIVNCVEFDLDNDGDRRYQIDVIVKLSLDGVTWSVGNTVSNVRCSGHKVVAFSRKKAQFVSIILGWHCRHHRHNDSFVTLSDLSNVHAAFM